MAYLGSYESTGQRYRREGREAKARAAEQNYAARAKTNPEAQLTEQEKQAILQAETTPVTVNDTKTGQKIIYQVPTSYNLSYTQIRDYNRTGVITTPVTTRTQSFINNVPVSTSFATKYQETAPALQEQKLVQLRSDVATYNSITNPFSTLTKDTTTTAKDARLMGAFNIYQDTAPVITRSIAPYWSIPASYAVAKQKGPGTTVSSTTNFFQQTGSKIGTSYNKVESSVSNAIFPYKESRGMRVFDPFSLSEKYSPFDVKESEAVRTRTVDNLGIATGIRREITEKPVATTALFVGSATARVGYSGAKLGLVKLAYYFPPLQKVGKVAGVVGKYGSYALGGAYGGVVAYNIGTSKEGVGVAIGREIVRESAIFGGFSVGGLIARPIDTNIQLELGFQKYPRGKQVELREEFYSAKKYLKDINAGKISPIDINYGGVEKLNPKAAKIVKGFAYEYRTSVVTGGSLSSKSQVVNPGVLRPSGDVDFYTDRPELARELIGRLQAGGIDAYGSGKWGAKIYIKGMGKAIEFNPLSERGLGNYYPQRFFLTKEKVSILETNIRSVSSPFKSWQSSILRTPSGLPVTDVGIQGARKLYGGFEISTDALGRTYMYRYSKDLPDFYGLVEASTPKMVSGGAGLSGGAWAGLSAVPIKIIPGDVGHVEIKPIYSKGDYVELYHGTPSKTVANKIKVEGLKSANDLGWTKGRALRGGGYADVEPSISATFDKNIALAYAGEKGEVLTIRIPKNEFRTGWNNLDISTDTFSLGTGEPNVMFSKSIPAKYIVGGSIKRGSGGAIFEAEYRGVINPKQISVLSTKPSYTHLASNSIISVGRGFGVYAVPNIYYYDFYAFSAAYTIPKFEKASGGYSYKEKPAGYVLPTPKLFGGNYPVKKQDYYISPPPPNPYPTPVVKKYGGGSYGGVPGGYPVLRGTGYGGVYNNRSPLRTLVNNPPPTLKKQKVLKPSNMFSFELKGSDKYVPDVKSLFLEETTKKGFVKGFRTGLVARRIVL